MPRRTWTTPMLPHFAGPDARSTVNGFQSLTEYLRGHIGFWGFFSGTTDGNGDLVITHNCGFIPEAVFIQPYHTVDHDLGAWHIDALTEDTVTVHFSKKSGSDSTNVQHDGYYLILPKVTER